MERFKNIAIIVVSIGLVLLVLGFAESSRRDVKFLDLIINIDVSQGNYFVDNLDIESNVFAHGYQKGVEKMAHIDVKALEAQFDANPSVKKSEVYTTLSGNLYVDIEQRTPIARVFTPMGSFYLDQEGYVMPLSDKYTAQVIVVNGYLPIKYEQVEGRNFGSWNNEVSKGKQEYKLYQAFTLAKKFNEVPFWDAQFKQIYFREDGDIELVPAVGNHLILLGGVDDLDLSLTKLMILYKEGLSKTGWNHYKLINLKYKDQIVCIKK